MLRDLRGRPLPRRARNSPDMRRRVRGGEKAANRRVNPFELRGLRHNESHGLIEQGVQGFCREALLLIDGNRLAHVLRHVGVHAVILQPEARYAAFISDIRSARRYRVRRLYSACVPIQPQSTPSAMGLPRAR